MKIEIEVSNLPLFSKALNNATAAYGDLVSALILGCAPQINSSNFRPLEKLSDEELKARMKELRNVYYQIVDLERRAYDE